MGFDLSNFSGYWCSIILTCSSARSRIRRCLSQGTWKLVTQTIACYNAWQSIASTSGFERHAPTLPLQLLYQILRYVVRILIPNVMRLLANFRLQPDSFNGWMRIHELLYGHEASMQWREDYLGALKHRDSIELATADIYRDCIKIFNACRSMGT